MKIAGLNPAWDTILTRPGRLVARTKDFQSLEAGSKPVRGAILTKKESIMNIYPTTHDGILRSPYEESDTDIIRRQIMRNDYKQCTLTKKNTKQVAYIPAKYAILGKYLRIGDDNGWKVETVSSHFQTSEENNVRSQDYKHTREASDI